MRRVLVTGATGFVGRRLCEVLALSGFDIRIATRRNDIPNSVAGFDSISVGSISEATNWVPALDGVDAVVHLAARVHMMGELARRDVDAYRLVNVDGTQSLAEQALREGVQHFVYMSTVKVHGERTDPNAPFSQHSPAKPSDAYSMSKFQAEEVLAGLMAEGLAVTVIRPPLVYGPGVGANFLRLMKLLSKRVPLPFGSIKNSRSFIALDNLVDIVRVCLLEKDARGRTFLVSDGEDLSTPELVELLGKALRRPARQLSVPLPILRTAAAAVGLGDACSRLTDSLQIDISHVRETLDWTAPVAVETALEEVARNYQGAP